MNLRQSTHFCAFVFSFFAVAVAPKASVSGLDLTADSTECSVCSETVDVASARVVPVDDFGMGLALTAAPLLFVPAGIRLLFSSQFLDHGARDFVVRSGLSPPHAFA